MRTNREVLRAYRRMLQETLRKLKEEIRRNQTMISELQNKEEVEPLCLTHRTQRVSELTKKLNAYRGLIIAAEGTNVKMNGKDPTYGKELHVPIRLAC